MTEPLDREQVLCNQLWGALDPGCGKRFVPRERFRKLMSNDEISRILHGKDDKLIKWVIDEATIVFAILVLMNMSTTHIREFYSNKINDKFLPILTVDSSGLTGADGRRVPLGSASRPRLENAQWNQFTNNQWLFLSFDWPTGDLPDEPEKIYPETPLPFTLKENRGGGGFSTLFSCDVHCDQLPPETKPGLRVAVKEIPQVEGATEIPFNREYKVLRTMKRTKNQHLVQLITAYKERSNTSIGSFIFPWADGGNLRQFWVTQSDHHHEEHICRWMFKQIRGIARALSDLDEEFKQYHENVRHGDLKPDNILWFRERSEGSPGYLAIADVGLAKVHVEMTSNRNKPTTTNAASIPYAGPENPVTASKKRKLSRRYDMWSMGCICMEFIIWLIYGIRELNMFIYGTETPAHDTQRLRQQYFTKKSFYTKIDSRLGDLAHEMRREPRCGPNTAVRKLMDLVIQKLLRPNYKDRIWPSDFADAMSDMCQEIDRGTLSVESDGNPHPRLPAINSGSACGLRFPRRRRYQNVSSGTQPYHVDPPVTDDWEMKVDNSFAKEVFLRLRINQGKLLASRGRYSVCEKCHSMPIWRPSFSIELSVKDLNPRSEKCGLCKLFLKCFQRPEVQGQTKAHLYRFGSTLRFNAHSLPALSICCFPGFPVDNEVPRHIQMGLPELPKAKSGIQFELLRLWLRDCDNEVSHRCKPRSDIKLPTRLLDVGNIKSETIRLCEKESGSDTRYIALSHRWGSFMSETLKENIESRKDSMACANLPSAFSDAVEVTRELGVKYLWIDSLCIVQDDPDDWRRESELMENVYSSAYCTISARVTSDKGFLKDRPARDYVKLEAGKYAPIYICEPIDDFARDVESAPLSRRGWVFQERVLSRRTIYFTDRQMYWECGEFIRCETLTRLQNQQVAFLSDPDFPRKMVNYDKGNRIHFYELLYSQYSMREFTKVTDRPIAISGLEKRLLRTLKTHGGYGVFGKYIGRGLLWRRGESSLSKIQGLDPKIPSWSWMAYEGGIEYMDIPFGQVQWNEQVKSSFEKLSNNGENTWHTGDESYATISAPVHSLKRSVAQETRSFIFDNKSKVDMDGLKCVVVGTRKSNRWPFYEQRRQYFVLLVRSGVDGQIGTYSRLGVATLEAQDINLESAGESAVIC